MVVCNPLKLLEEWLQVGLSGFFLQEVCLPSSLSSWDRDHIFRDNILTKCIWDCPVDGDPHLFPTFIYFLGKKQCADPGVCGSLVQESTYKFWSIICLTFRIGLLILYT